jgi:aminomethyltransferase
MQWSKSAEILQSISETDIKSMKYFTDSMLKLKDINGNFCGVVETCCPGEDGFEVRSLRAFTRI